MSCTAGPSPRRRSTAKRSDRRVAVRAGTDRDSLAAAVPLQQSQLLVPAVERDRLRDRHAAPDGPERLRRDRHRRCSWARRNCRRANPGTAAQDVRVRGAAAGAVPGASIISRFSRSRYARESVRRVPDVSLQIQSTPRSACARPRHGGAGSGGLQVLRFARRRRAVSELHAGDRRKRPAGRTQPAVFCGAEPGRAWHARSSGATIP